MSPKSSFLVLVFILIYSVQSDVLQIPFAKLYAATRHERRFIQTGPTVQAQSLPLVAGARAKLQWTVTIKCAMLYEDIIDLFLVLEDNYAAAKSSDLATPDTVPCRYFLGGMTVDRTIIIIRCDDMTASYGLALQKLLTVRSVLDTCQWSVQRDGVVKHKALQTTQSVSNLWHLDRLDQRNLPLNSQYTYVGDGAGVIISIIDTGCVVSHVDFGGRATFVANYAGDGVDNDCNGHGTHVASTAAGTTYGVAKAATIYCYKSLDCDGFGSFSSVSLAIYDVMDRQTTCPVPEVVSMSLAGGFYQPINDDVDTLVNTYDVGVTVAAGNSGTNAINYSPASAASALTVAASTTTDGLASFSNRGSIVDIAAPGVDVRAANYLTNGSTLMSGTSMSTPIVAGLVALQLQDDMNQLGNFSGKSAMAKVKAMATVNKIDAAGDGFPPMPLAFSSIGSTPVPQPPSPPPPPPAPPLPPPQSNEALPFGNPASSSTAEKLVAFMGHPVFLFFLLQL